MVEQKPKNICSWETKSIVEYWKTHIQDFLSFWLVKFPIVLWNIKIKTKHNIYILDCPSSLTYGGGSQKYRFVEHINSLPPPQYLPCTGDIDKCVYTAHRKYYCMMGNKPDYTPFELNPHHDQITPKNVSTFVGTIDESDTNSIFETWSEPLISIKLFPNDYGVSINQLFRL